MAITEKQQRFIEEIAKNVQKYAYVYGILVHSPSSPRRSWNPDGERASWPRSIITTSD